ncbi:DUF3027 domain-containing protein [Microbacterium sp. 22242]|uniref:DUF3027 domain-containing protein n=1 Tax=Microbacterium sp. 22242 TaxID=3453896 RepID=UPI003F862EEB
MTSMPEAGSGESAEDVRTATADVDAPSADAAARTGTTPYLSERLLDARDLALAALHEITPASTVGPPAGYLPEADGVISLRFENRLAGYPSWYWTVTVAQVGDEEPTVLETELLPGAGALLAPEWVPWAERLAEYRAHQAELAAEAEQESADADAAEGAAAADDLSDEEILDEDVLDDDELDEEDELDDDEDPAPRLHAGDVDGVDIDELDDSVAEDEFDGSDEDDDDQDDEGDDSEEE